MSGGVVCVRTCTLPHVNVTKHHVTDYYHANVFGFFGFWDFGPSQNASFIEFRGTPSISVFVQYLTDNVGLRISRNDNFTFRCAPQKDNQVVTNKFPPSFKFVAQIWDTFETL